MLLTATLSAIVVASVYEVRGRLAKRRAASDAPASSSQQPASPIAPLERRTSLEDSCTTLRRHYLVRCPGDVLAEFPPSGQPAPPGTSTNPETEARAMADLTAWLNPSPAELGELAKRCEVRFVIPTLTENQPPTVTEEDASALSLSAKERALLDRTMRDMHTDLRDFAVRAYGEGAGRSAKASGLTLEEMLSDLQTRPENGFEEARQKFARERGGLASPPASATHQPPGERLLRLWAAMGDELERRLADGVGTERAHQLRFSPHATWTNRFSFSGCPSQP